ncbi:hypothetical protein MAPG_06656 [Magnaporthiopsis poae ATCC 64411]|uniref:Uncharacterized protein n=1 Tax=Magnaporthiopsis poae (strain ATCC 64411 / 73-15) TaxID=644358 RepID=A0A0C4E2L5_MAGP6|nr:hypothetical protein MAPG_06656 [Magnaporthiopsis poae ATCC 64411]
MVVCCGLCAVGRATRVCKQAVIQSGISPGLWRSQVIKSRRGCKVQDQKKKPRAQKRVSRAREWLAKQTNTAQRSSSITLQLHTHSALEICLLAGPPNHGADYPIGMEGPKKRDGCDSRAAFRVCLQPD